MNLSKPEHAMPSSKSSVASATDRPPFRGRSRNAGHPTPPAQIRTCATHAYDSYLECIPSNRLFGQGCTTLGCGSASRKN
jgi:hypothetical protein